jgi:hypothetical protein
VAEWGTSNLPIAYMKIDKKYTQSGWSKKHYREIRRKLNKFLFEEEML